MIYIISGAIDSGKSQKIAMIYQNSKKGDGWISRKIYLKNKFIGYELERLSTGDKVPFAFFKDYLPMDLEISFTYGPFYFSKKGLEFAIKISKNIIKENIDPVYIDEVGPLELNGKGFHSILTNILRTGKDIYLVIRTHCVEEVLKKYEIKEYQILV